ncbi:MipA/OmpV family protein [Aliiglaciecola sp. M165]|nr:MipA/OmpV family protein [Aliiglaciecola sp. M165]
MARLLGNTTLFWKINRMLTNKKTLAIASLCFLSTFSVQAQWSAGVIGIGQSNPYIGGDTGLNVFPIVAYEGEKLVWRGPFLDYYVVGTTRTETSVSVNLALAANDFETDGDPALVGIEDRDISLMAGFTFNQELWNGQFSATLQTEVTNEHQGQRATVGWSTAIAKDPRFKWRITAGVEVEYLSDKYADYYYGVSAREQQNSAFAAYDVGSVIQPQLTLGGYYSFNKNWRLIGNLGWQFLASDIKDSPIIDGDTVVDGFIGVTYSF